MNVWMAKKEFDGRFTRQVVESTGRDIAKMLLVEVFGYSPPGLFPSQAQIDGLSLVCPSTIETPEEVIYSVRARYIEMVECSKVSEHVERACRIQRDLAVSGLVRATAPGSQQTVLTAIDELLEFFASSGDLCSQGDDWCVMAVALSREEWFPSEVLPPFDEVVVTNVGTVYMPSRFPGVWFRYLENIGIGSRLGVGAVSKWRYPVPGETV